MEAQLQTQPQNNQTGTSCYQLPNGKSISDYIADAGFALGFGVGNAVRLCFKSGIVEDPVRKQKYMNDCTWYINYTSKNTHTSKDEIATIVSRITANIERDRISEIQ